MTVPPLRPSDDVIVAHLEGEAVLLHLGSKRYFRLNDTAAAIWRGIESGADETAIAEQLVDSFAVEHDEAVRELARVLGDLRRNALVRSDG